MARVFLGLGSNLGDRRANLRRALELLVERGALRLERTSSVYETEPVGPVKQEKFLNAVVSGETGLSPLDLLDACREVEDSIGRRRSVHWGPRTIDLDILLYDDETVDLEELRVPHPRLGERAFVLVPLAEIAPDLILPSGERVSERLAAVSKHGVHRVGSIN